MLLHIMDFMVIMPLSPFYEKAINVPVSLVGSIVGIYTFCAAFSSMLLGGIINRYTRKSVILFCLTGLMIATTLTASSWDAISMLSFRLIAGIFGGPVAALATTLIADNIEVTFRGRAMGIVMSSFAVSSTLAIPISIFIAGHFGWRFCFYCLSSIMLVTIIVIVRVPITLKQPSATQSHKAYPQLLKNQYVWLAILSIGISMASMFALIPNFANFFVFNRGLKLSDLSTMFILGGLSSTACSLLGGFMTDKIGPIVSCFICTSMIVVAMISQINLNVMSISLFYVLVMGGSSIRTTAVMTQISQIPTLELRASFMSLQNAVRNLMMAVGAAGSGLLISTSTTGKLIGMDTLSIIASVASLLIPIMMIVIGFHLQHRQPK